MDRLAQAERWRVIGVDEYNALRPTRAARALRRALDLATGEGQPANPVLVARILVALAGVEGELSGLAPGLARLDQVTALSADGSIDGVYASMYNQRALLFVRVGRTGDALAMLTAAEPWLPAASSVDRAKILLNRGGVNLVRGVLPAARDDLTRCAELARQNGLTEQHAKALHNLGIVEHLSGHLPDALRILDQAAGLGAGVNRGLVLDTRARIQLEAGLIAEADESLAEAVDIFRRDRSIQDLAEAELARADCALVAGDAGAAARLARRAASRFRRRGNNWWAGSAELTRLQAELALGRHTASIVDATRALHDDLAHAGRAAASRAAGFLVVQALLANGQVDAAAATARRIGPARRSDPIAARLDTRLVRTRLHVARGNRAAARRQLRLGLRELATYQATFGSVDLRTASAIYGRRLAELDVRLALGTGRADAVLGAVDRAGAMSSRLLPVRPPADRRTAELLTQLRATIADLRADGADATRAGRRRELEREIKARSWALAASSPEVRPALPVREIRNALDAADVTLVMFVELDRALVAIVAGRAATRVSPLGPAADVHALTRRVRADLDLLAYEGLPPAIAATASASLRRSAAQLDQALLAPIELPAGRLVIVPSGALAAVAWGSLPAGRGRPITVAPSASAWVAANQIRRPGRVNAGVVAVAGPDLPRAGAEARQVAASWRTRPRRAVGTESGSPPPRTLVGRGAHRDAFLAAMTSSSVVHVAAHGVHQTESPLFSSLRLADGPVFAYELDHAPDHVILSACELGLSTVRPGDEALGLTSALLQLGTRCVIGGVARVADEVAHSVMTAYHRDVARGADAADALAAATAASERPAPFVCFGASWSAELGVTANAPVP